MFHNSTRLLRNLCSVFPRRDDWFGVARYAQTYAGERRTCSIGIKLTPTERAALEAAAEVLGLPLSAYLRSLCVKRSPAVAAETRRSPQAKELLRELGAIGKDLNQLAQHASTRNELPSHALLQSAMDALKDAMGHVIEL